MSERLFETPEELAEDVLHTPIGDIPSMTDEFSERFDDQGQECAQEAIEYIREVQEHEEAEIDLSGIKFW